jgi:bifunctional DNA-binding transcriptional regulator/antitoxin component of YhaV-PrlF toxin-antitoxin module
MNKTNENPYEVTIPVDIWEKAGFGENTKPVFDVSSGKIIVESAASVALREFREAMRGCAEEAGWKDEQDVVAFCKEMRKTSWERYINYKNSFEQGNSAAAGTI